MNTVNEVKLLNLLDGDKKKLKEWFNNFNRKSNSINDWQKFLGYPLEPHSCTICHRIRNNIASGLGYWFGENHLGKEFKEIAEIDFNEAKRYITEGSKIRRVMNEVYPQISKLIYE